MKAGKLVLAKERADVSALAQGVLSAFQHVHPQRDFILAAQGPLMVEVDALRLGQVITNLLDNAVKFSPEGTPVEVAVGRDGHDTVRIAVRDHGSGIPAEKCADIFERFYCLTGRRKRRCTVASRHDSALGPMD